MARSTPAPEYEHRTQDAAASQPCASAALSGAEGYARGLAPAAVALARAPWDIHTERLAKMGAEIDFCARG